MTKQLIPGVRTCGVLALCCALALLLTACQPSTPTGDVSTPADPASSSEPEAEPEDEPKVEPEVQAEPEDTTEPADEAGGGNDADETAPAEEESAPATQSILSTETATIPASFFTLFVLDDDYEACLASLGAIEITANEDGSYTAKFPNEDYTTFINILYFAVQTKMQSVLDNETYVDLLSIDYDETFATVVVVIDREEIPEEDETLAKRLGQVANLYQTVSGLPVECDVIVMSSSGSQLSETLYSSSSS